MLGDKQFLKPLFIQERLAEQTRSFTAPLGLAFTATRTSAQENWPVGARQRTQRGLPQSFPLLVSLFAPCYPNADVLLYYIGHFLVQLNERVGPKLQAGALSTFYALSHMHASHGGRCTFHQHLPL